MADECNKTWGKLQVEVLATDVGTSRVFLPESYSTSLQQWPSTSTATTVSLFLARLLG
ncbi:hypothetical protein ACP4OV_019829 [Aristida adscensionis]